MPKTAALAFRISEELKAALERAATAEDRSVSSVAERALSAWLLDNGYLSKAPAKRKTR